MSLVGPIVAVVTPFDSRGNVDEGALRDNLQFLNHHGVGDIVANGTTGEFASLTLEERMRVLELCREVFKGRVISHISSCCDRDCRVLLEHASDHADAVLLLPPFYYAGISTEGCLSFFRHVLESCRLPTYLYNFPRHTQLEIAAELLNTLSGEFACIAGIKDSCGDLTVSQQYKRACPRLQVFVGNDRGALQALQAGLDGSVTGGGNPVPECLVHLRERFKSGDLRGAQAAQERLDAWTTLRESIPLSDIATSKAALGIRIPGYPPYVRPPLIGAGPEVLALLRSTFLATQDGFEIQRRPTP
jgi:4-hydroxy-tetrahydrodipicolinate synthase